MEERTCDIIVLGGGPAGMTAAIYAKRANLDVVLLETNVTGGLVNSTYTVENFPSYPEIHGMELMEKMREHVDHMGVEVEEVFEVTGLELGEDEKAVHGDGIVYKAPAIILATGRKPLRWTCPPNAIRCTSARSATALRTKASACSWSAAGTAPSTKACTS